MDNAINYIRFLQEYNKLLERGVKDILNSSVSSKYIWIDDIKRLISSKLCKTSIEEIFSFNEDNIEPTLLKLQRPVRPQIKIPTEFQNFIRFDDIKNKFEKIDKSIDDFYLDHFNKSIEGKSENAKIKRYLKNKDIFSKLYKAYSDIRFDSNYEIVLSVGLIQYCKEKKRGDEIVISKTNQHLFHFPLKIDLVKSNELKISFSEIDKPYSDFFFLNNTPIEKNILTNLIDRFEEGVNKKGYSYINLKRFKKIIHQLQNLSSNTKFENSILKPKSDISEVDQFKILLSPAINIKRKKPRFFNKLTESIIEEIKKRQKANHLFNLLIRNPENKEGNSYIKENYFIDALFEEYKENIHYLEAKEDFSTFFPLPFNDEQKEIYENFLRNRITVVTGPPGTGKSHTIVNILCVLLAQGNKVLVTAHTDKALESLLEKIPKTFDDLVFTKISIDNDKSRFSLENSISRLKSILLDKSILKIKNKIIELDTLKQEYLKHKSYVIKALEREYKEITLNNSFKNLRSYEIWDKLKSKDPVEWNWIKDSLYLDKIKSFDNLYKNLINYIKLSKTKDLIANKLDFNIEAVIKTLNSIDFEEFLILKEKIGIIKSKYGLNDNEENKLLDIDIDSVLGITKIYSSDDIVLKSLQKVYQLKTKINETPISFEKFISNLSYSKIISNSEKYLRDIESYLSLIGPDKEKIKYLNKFNKNYKAVKYLEDIVLNEKRCNDKSCLKELKKYIKKLKSIHNKLKLIKSYGYIITLDEDSSIISKSESLLKAIKLVDRNFQILNEIETNENIIRFSKIFNIEITDIEGIFEKALTIKKDLKKLKQYKKDIKQDLNTLKKISKKLQNSKLKERFNNLIPIEIKLNHKVLLKELSKLKSQISDEKVFNNSIDFLKKVLPQTFENLNNVPLEYITIENLEYSHADSYLKDNNIIDFQKTKRKLKIIKDKIFSIKSQILFDLSKYNFKKEFDENSIDNFINLLENYKNNLRYANSSIRDKVKFQNLVRKNSKEISKKLSCWVMKFNDVLDSVGNTSEIFDCIIVDEASQLNFNSLLLGYYARNMIIVGDEKQTSPSALTGASGKDFDSIKNKYLYFLGDEKLQIRSDNSLFSLAEMIAGKSNLSLKEHFRCVPEIIEFSKFYFYNNSLIPLKQINSSNRLEPIKSKFIPNSFLEDKIVLKEIESIKIYLEQILNSHYYQNKTIGVISLGLVKHTEALKEIKEELTELFGREKIDKAKLLIEDPQKFQGDERDVILISLGVALDSEKIKNNLNPKPYSIVDNNNLKDELKKINVALSRAKEQMILFHSVNLDDLKSNDFRRKIISFFKNKEIKQKCFSLPPNETERNRYNVPKPFDSWFEYDIAKDLINEGYCYIEPQYKVKENKVFLNPRLGKEVFVNFKLDLVITNNNKKVAIECDGDPFHSLPEDIDYDVVREEFLTRVGWKVHRILYSSYKRDPSYERQKLFNFIEENTKKDKTFRLSEISGSEKTNVNLPKEFTNQPNTLPLDYNKKESKYIDKIDVDKIDVDKSESISKLNKKSNYPSNINIIDEHITENKIICYFNLMKNGNYLIHSKRYESALFSIPIKENDIDKYLLQCYDSGHINKVPIYVILEKKENHLYRNGLNLKSTLNSIEIVNKNDILGIFIYSKNKTLFKAHLINDISSHQNLNSKGNKVIYEKFNKCKYKILHKELKDDMSRLIFNSFTAKGKSIRNKYYKREWELLNISSFNNGFEIPNLFNNK